MGSFQPVALEDRATISRYLRFFPENEASECTFTNLYIWSNAENIQWRLEDGCMLLRERPNGVWRYLIAFAEESRLPYALDAAIAAADKDKEPFSMHSLPGWYCDMIERLMPGRFMFEREPHLDDYVYNTKDLIKLTGKKYHGKRNHINKFIGVYGSRYAYAPYEPSMRDACMDVYNRWFLSQQDSADLRAERDSVERALRCASALAIDGGVILIDGIPQAFTLGERITRDMAVIHIEKINPDIPELFSLINREFAANAFPDTLWINREEDMGDEGLRRAKASYQPARMIEKYMATLA